MKNRSGQQKFQMFGLLLIALACSAALLGGLGAIHYMNGSMLQSGATLVMPAYLGYWAWQARDNLRSEPLIPIFAGAWLCGLPLGLLVHQVGKIFN